MERGLKDGIRGGDNAAAPVMAPMHREATIAS